MVIQRVNGCVWAITAGQWANWNVIHVAEKYSKFVYSSKYAFSIPHSYYILENAGTINCSPNTNLIFPETNIKAIKYVFPVGKTTVTTEIVYPVN